MSGVEPRPLRIALIAGEVSGDILGADLIPALRAAYPNIEFCGVTGPLMREAGCESLADIEELSLFGISEVLLQIPRLLALRRRLAKDIRLWGADLCVGIDAPSFNLGLEQRLKKQGMKTAHYVSPTIWAWRKGRIHEIGRSVDLMLTLFPFEQALYEEHGIPSTCVGHPLADRFPECPDQLQARQQLGLDEGQRWLALMPGSRGSEVRSLAEPFIETAHWLATRNPDLGFIVPCANNRVRAVFSTIAERLPDVPRLKLIDGQSQAAMTAADAVLLASGTAALEACLLKRPMVVAYRVSAFTYFLLRGLGMLKVAHVSLPNHLTDRPRVPEFIQQKAQAKYLGPAVQALLGDHSQAEAQTKAFAEVHQDLRRDASTQAARALLGLLGHRC